MIGSILTKSILSPASLTGRIVRLPLKLIPSDWVVPVLSGQARGRKWIKGASLNGCWLGNFEVKKQKLFARMVQPGSVVYDIGAHTGFYSLIASKLVGKNGQVIAFEPLPRNLAFLKKHLTLNHTSNVKVIEAAVSDSDGKAFFEQGLDSHMGFIRADSLGSNLEVTTHSIDSLLGKNLIRKPDYIKMDIEGAEYKALSGAKNTLALHHPTIFLATHGSQVHQQCCDFLTALGYTLKPVDSENIGQAREIVAVAG